MHDGLGVDEDLDLVLAQAEEMAGLDHLKAFVHQSGGIEADAAAHVPGGMAEGILEGGGAELLGRPAQKGAAGGGEDDAGGLAGSAAAQALVNGAVFAVNRQDGNATAASQGHEERAGDNQGFLVGEGQAAALIEGGMNGGEAGDAHGGGYDHGGAAAGGGFDEAFRAGDDARGGRTSGFTGRLEAAAQVRGGGGAAHRNQRGAEARDLFGEPGGILAGRQGHDLEATAEAGDHVQSIAADGAGGSEQSDAPRGGS